MSSQNETITNQSCSEVTLNGIRDFLLSRGGKCKYSELFNHFNDAIVEHNQDDKFQEILNTIATKKCEVSSISIYLLFPSFFFRSILI